MSFLLNYHRFITNEENLIIHNPKTYETKEWAAYLNKYIPLLHGKVVKNIEKAKGYQKTFYDKGKKTKYDYDIGELVVRRNLEKGTFPKERWLGPYKILSKNNDDGTSWKIVKVSDPNNFVTTANVRHMRPYYSQEQQKEQQNLQQVIKLFTTNAENLWCSKQKGGNVINLKNRHS